MLTARCPAVPCLALAWMLTFAVSNSAIAAQRWDVVELSFVAAGAPAEPFAVEFGAVVRHTDGQSLRVSGYYDGGRQWQVRFCPPVAGTWSYTTFSSRADLAGQTGEVVVSEAANDGQRGPVEIDPENPRRFRYADGSPYFVMAFELDWLFALDAENGDDIPRTREIVSTVREHGFNQIVMNVFAYDAKWGEKDKIDPANNFAKPSVFPFGGDNENPDFSTLDVEYFQRFDRVVEHLNEQGIVAHVMIYVWNKQVSWPEAESAADNRFFDYVVKRYQAFPNLIWDISKEALDYGHDDIGYITRRIERLRELDAHDRLVTVHDYLYCKTFPDQVDFISIQEWQPFLYHRMLQVAEAHANEPVFNIEHGGYEKTTHSIFDGAYTDPQTCLDRCYQCLFAGTYPTYYWQNTSWYNVIVEPFALPEEQQPHFRYYKHLTDFVGQFNFNELKATQETFLPPMLSDGQGTFLFYCPDNRKGVFGRTTQLGGTGVIKYRWFDPLTGEYHGGGTQDLSQSTWLGISRPKGITGPTAIAIVVIDGR